jgi:amino acid transporter
LDLRSHLNMDACYLGLVVSFKLMLEHKSKLMSKTGHKVYLEFTYRYPRFLASTVVAVYAVFLGFSASNCIIFSEYVLFALGIDGTQLIRKLLAVSLLTAITIIHGCFLSTGIMIQNFLGWVKIGLIVFMIFTSLFVVAFRRGNHGITIQQAYTQELTWDSIWTGSVWNLEIIATSLFKVFYSYAGLENINNVLNEVKNPVRTLKSVAPTALITACILYLLINIAYLLIIPLDQIKESRELIAALFFERTFGISVGKRILPLAVALSAVGNVMVVSFALVFARKL